MFGLIFIYLKIDLERIQTQILSDIRIGILSEFSTVIYHILIQDSLKNPLALEFE